MSDVNSELVRKADLAASDLNTAGKLTVEQFDRFYQKLMIEPTLLQAVRMIPMTKPDMEINKIGFGSRILRPAAAEGLGATLAATDRVKPALSKVTVSTVELQAEIVIPYSVLEDNIEKDNLSDTIIDLAAQRSSIDLEEFGLLSTTGNGDAFLAQMPGWLEKVSSNVVDAELAKLNKDVLLDVAMALPDQFTRNLATYRHFVSRKNDLQYRNTIADRQTPAGDAIIAGMAPVYAFGTALSPVSQMPAANGLYTDPKNLIFGIHREVLIEVDKDIRGRVYFAVLTIRCGTAIEEEEGAVKLINLTDPQT